MSYMTMYEYGRLISNTILSLSSFSFIFYYEASPMSRTEYCYFGWRHNFSGGFAYFITEPVLFSSKRRRNSFLFL